MVFSHLILREAWKEDELRSGRLPFPHSCQPVLHSLSWCLELIHGCSTWVFEGCYCPQVFLLRDILLSRSVKHLFIHKVLFATHQGQGSLDCNTHLGACSYGGTVSVTKAAQEVPRECPAELQEVGGGSRGLFPEVMSRDARQIRKKQTN